MVRGRLEVFQKFIEFGPGSHPLDGCGTVLLVWIDGWMDGIEHLTVVHVYKVYFYSFCGS